MSKRNRQLGTDTDNPEPSGGKGLLGAMREDDRGAAEAVGVLLALGMLTIFLSSVVAITGMATESATDANARERLDFTGEQLSATIEDIDRRVRASATTAAIGTSVMLPETVSGEQYTIEIQSSGANRYEMQLSRDGSETVVTTEFRSETTVNSVTVRGGELRVIRKDGESAITVEEAGTN